MESGRLTAVAALAATLALGIVLGAIGAGALRRHEPPRREPSDFPQRIWDIVQPRNAAQRAQLEPIVLATDARNRATVDSTRTLLLVNLEEMAQSLDTLLDQDQRVRLRDFVVEMRRMLPGAPVPGLTGRPPGRGGPPPPGPIRP